MVVGELLASLKLTGVSGIWGARLQPSKRKVGCRADSSPSSLPFFKGRNTRIRESLEFRFPGPQLCLVPTLHRSTAIHTRPCTFRGIHRISARLKLPPSATWGWAQLGGLSGVRHHDHDYSALCFPPPLACSRFVQELYTSCS